MASILQTTKQMLGLPAEYDAFDEQIILHINSVFTILQQLGVGPSQGFKIEDDEPEWADYLTSGMEIEAVKTYMYLKVKYLFDPPANSAFAEALNRTISEFEWRLSVITDSGGTSKEDTAT